MTAIIIGVVSLMQGRRNRVIGGKDDKPVAVIRSHYLPYAFIQSRLPGWKIVREPVASAQFVYADGDKLFEDTRRVNRIRADLKCRLDAPALYDKAQLHLILMDPVKGAPKTICRTIEATDTTPAPDGTWILRANWGWHGLANAVTNSPDEFHAAVKKLMNIRPEDIASDADQKYIKTIQADAKIICSKYIRNPMLFHEYKFHLRILVVAMIDAAGALKVWVKNTGIIIPAAEKYVDNKYDDSAIHDTHMKNNTKMLGLYPRDLPAADPTRVNDLIRDVFTAMTPYIKKYDEAKNAYDVYGLDVMLTHKGSPKLIEVNRYPSFMKHVLDGVENDFHLNGEEFDKEIFDTVIETAFGDVFGEKTAPALSTRLI